jgi:hypothetical protein
MKTGKIVAYEPNGSTEIKGKQYSRYMVTFADGQKWKFLCIGDFKKKIGQEVNYIIKNEEYKNASFVPDAKPITTSFKRPANTNDSILLQVCYKENMSAYAKENRSSVIEYTKEDFYKLKEILNNI